MKSYLNNNTLQNYQARQRWIEEHPNLLSDLLPQCKLIMCLVYHVREFEKISSKTQFFNMAWANLNRYMKLLEQLGFLYGKQYGREKRFRITQKGDIFVLELFKYFKTGHAQSQNSPTASANAEDLISVKEEVQK